MKKISLIFTVAIIMAVAFVACNKEDNVMPKQFASVVSGEFIPSDTDVFLKSAPDIGGYLFDAYDIKHGASVYSRIDGSEFFPGSAAQLDWDGSTTVWFSSTQPVYITYCPVLPMKVVLTAVEGDEISTPSYLGIWAGTPDEARFPIPVLVRRLGDVLTLNIDALTSLPGYTNMSFDVEYTESVINLPATIEATTSTASGWPNYQYSGTSSVTESFDATTGSGDQTVYEGLDAKVTGTITITIHVDGIDIAVQTDATDLGKGMNMILTTTRVGWYNSGTIGITEDDINIDTRNIPVE
ncbi:MAG: hypothetical protein PF488_01935 [Patescibacteria group bacterium]|jgi:hypothetical protein|nr:hypothetical protein [Patescibacteria group bacterium]